jgi:prefoldin subunit 5
MDSGAGIYKPRIARARAPVSPIWVDLIVRYAAQDLLQPDPEVVFESVNSFIGEPISILNNSYTRFSQDAAGVRRNANFLNPTDDHVLSIEHDIGQDQVEIDMDREELKAHLEAQDARIDVRLQSFEQTVKDAMAQIRLDSAEAKGEMKAMHVELGHMKNIKGAVWGAAGATIIGVGSILAAMLSFGVASFDTGRETSQLVESAKQQTQATQKLLEQIQQQQKMLTAPPVSTEKAPTK